jgi:transcriptional regulator with XRE-family HTH domain
VTTADRIKHVRANILGLTQQELAEQLESRKGKSPNPVNVSRWERGASEPSLNYVRQIAALAGLPVSYFFEDEVPVA